MEEKRLDLRMESESRCMEAARTTNLLFQINHTNPLSDEYGKLIRQLFTGGIGKDSMVHPPFYMNLAENIHIGKNVVIMPYFKCMSAGNVYIEDNVRIALNVSVITNNHDFYDRQILTIKDIHIGKNAWIGAGATILPGVIIGENAIVGAGSIVTKDVAANTIVVGNPAKVVKNLDPEKFCTDECGK